MRVSAGTDSGCVGDRFLQLINVGRWPGHGRGLMASSHSLPSLSSHSLGPLHGPKRYKSLHRPSVAQDTERTQAKRKEMNRAKHTPGECCLKSPMAAFNTRKLRVSGLLVLFGQKRGMASGRSVHVTIRTNHLVPDYRGSQV